MAIRAFQSIVSFALLFTLMTIAPTAQAESGQTYKVGTSHLNIRSTPSHDGQLIGKLDKGDQVVIFKESHGWGQTYYNGEESWVALHYLYADDNSPQASAVKSSTTPTNVTVAESNVRVRSGPGTSYHMVASAGNQDSFQLLDSENDWYKVALNNGDSGWIASWLTNDSANAPSQSNQKSTTQHTNRSLSGYTIVLDPGHGGHDPGSIALDGSYEKHLVLSTAQVVADQLRAAGATVVMTRTTDDFLSLENRVSVSNSYETDAFISLHYDAYPISAINGFSTHFYTSFGNDHKLAQAVQSGLAQHTNLNSRGIMQNNYYVLRENRDLAVLVELGFMTNPYDLSTIQTQAHQNNVAEGITNGLINYFQ